MTQFKKGDRVRLHSVPLDHPWRKPYSGRFGSNSPAATHGAVVGLCRDPAFVRFKTVQTLQVEYLELDPDYKMTMPELIAENEQVLDSWADRSSTP